MNHRSRRLLFGELSLEKGYVVHGIKRRASQFNVGFGSDVTIAELAQTVARVVGYPGRVSFDTSKPDRAQRKLMDSGRLNAMGWQARVDLEQGPKQTNQDMTARLNLVK